MRGELTASVATNSYDRDAGPLDECSFDERRERAVDIDRALSCCYASVLQTDRASDPEIRERQGPSLPS
jgi:hypothetical protein